MKRANRKTKLLVGSFAVAFVVVVALTLLMAGDDLALFRKKSQYFVVFRDASGLQAGAPVKIGGVTVGNVDAVVIDSSDDPPKVVTTLTIFSPHNDLVRLDSVAQLETQGVLGDKFVAVTPGSADEKKLSEGDFLRAKNNIELSTTIAKSAEIVADTATAIKKLNLFTDSLPADAVMQSITADIQTAVHNLSDMLQSLGGKKSAVHLLSEAETSQAIEKTLLNLQQTSEHLVSVARKIDQGEGTLGALINDPSLYDDMKTLMGRANRSKVAKFVIRKTLEPAEEAKK